MKREIILDDDGYEKNGPGDYNYEEDGFVIDDRPRINVRKGKKKGRKSPKIKTKMEIEPPKQTLEEFDDVIKLIKENKVSVIISLLFSKS